jgi:ribonuclease BN (tRNA processing enzyme)
MHGIPNLAIALSKGERKITYSGDTAFSNEIVKLARNSDLLIHDAFCLDKDKPADHSFSLDIAIGLRC